MKVVYLQSLLYRRSWRLRASGAVVLGRPGDGRWQTRCAALAFLRQLLRRGRSQDAHGRLAVADGFRLGHESNHHSHFLHHLFQSRFLKRDEEDTTN